ncbi:hypothetical protein P3S67_032249 [Capsicum chacoense]
MEKQGEIETEKANNFEKIKLIPIGLEVMQICYTNLKASISAEVGCFIKNLLEISPDILREYLIHLQEHMDLIHHDKLFDLLARVRALIKEESTLVLDLEEKSRNKESTDKTSRATLDLLKNIELLKEDLRYVYLKAPDSYQCCFPMNDGPLFMHLLLIHLNGLLASNSYSIALIKEEITLVKEALEFIRSFFVNVEQELYKNLWARVLDVAYEAKDAIDSIIGRDNDVSQLLEKIPKNKSLIVVNIPKNPVERKSMTAGKIILGFEETNWLITKLTSGPKDLDVISITGMPGSGKTTLAYKVHNDDLVCCHFDLRAWCTVDQEYDEKKLLVKLFNQVIGSDFKSSEDIDVADKLRKQLYGKRHLILLDDVWDINTWDDLTRPFPGAEKGSCPDELLAVGKEISQNYSENVMKVIQLSYDHLPHQLKPCFLYLASYQRDTEIDTHWLKMYWRSEGIVEQTEMMSLEEVIEIYLDKLISSSLVIAFNEIGNYPTCQLHDLVHDFCLIKAREEKLFGEISSSDAPSSSDLMPRTVKIVYNKEQFELYNFIPFGSKMKRHSCKSLCSLEITGDEMEDRLSDSCHLRDLRLLRVLSLNPSFMMNWDKNEPILIVEDLKLENLRILQTLVLSYSKEIEDIFIRFPNLQRLVFDIKESWDYSPELYWFPNLDFLHELETLEVVFESSITNDNGPSAAANWSWDFHLPSNLKILSWLNFPLTYDSLSIIARLPNLEHLFLTRTIIKGGEWNMREEDTLENLKFLMLDNVTLAKWEFGEESFPVLEKSQLWGCHMLEEIPPNFGDIGSLKIIQLVESPQLEDSALEIKEYVEDIMGRDLEVLGPNNIPLFK